MDTKYMAVLVSALTSAGVWAQSADPRQSDLRSAIRETATGSRTVAPRQLSDPERAEMRRQLSQAGLTRPKGS